MAGLGLEIWSAYDSPADVTPDPQACADGREPEPPLRVNIEPCGARSNGPQGGEFGGLPADSVDAGEAWIRDPDACPVPNWIWNDLAGLPDDDEVTLELWAGPWSTEVIFHSPAVERSLALVDGAIEDDATLTFEGDWPATDAIEWVDIGWDGVHDRVACAGSGGVLHERTLDGVQFSNYQGAQGTTLTGVLNDGVPEGATALIVGIGFRPGLDCEIDCSEGPLWTFAEVFPL